MSFGTHVHVCTTQYDFIVNRFTAIACKISGLKGSHTRLQTVYFPIRRRKLLAFDENPFTC